MRGKCSLRIRPLSKYAYRELIKDRLFRVSYGVLSNDIHLKESAEWLLRAQSVGIDNGVSRMYSLLSGWGPSYPETTGYIIPTLIEYSKLSSDKRYLNHALEMADWLVEIQLEGGGVMAGTVDANPVTPTIFNTGQNLFGWMAAYKETKDEKYLQAAQKAASWMVDAQDEDGCWSRYHSPFAGYQVNTYNVRSAFGLCGVYEITEEPKILASINKNVEWVLLQQNAKGWFANNCLSKNETPLTHTIGYTIEGLLGIGFALKNETAINAAQKAAEELLSVQYPDGSLSGLYDENWQPKASWVCLTGLAQIAICWWLLYRHTGNHSFKDAALMADNYLKSKQNTESKNPGIRGGIKGSYPVNGSYGPYQYLNWAVKFFMDALMLEQSILKEEMNPFQ